MAPIVRRLTITDDLEAFGQIVLSSYHALPGRPPEPEYDAELVDVAARVVNGVVFGAFGDELPLGCVTYVPDAASPLAEGLRADEAGFRMLAVSPIAQRRGVGAALVTRCIDEALAAGRAAMFIHSGDWMVTAQRLYRRLGFVRVADRDWTFPELSMTLLGFRRAL